MTERELFTAALSKADPAERAAFLDEQCSGNVPLRQRIESLLAEHQQLGSFMDVPSSAATIDQPAERPGTQIGPYKLLQQIGEGGMGVVYMAEQHEPVKRRVALKIIKPGMDTRQVIARFEAERQALSLMDHPNIAKVLDAGTTGEPGSVSSGRPYFVMELVKGQPITQYCDEKHLTPRQRLELLLPVCQAIQHAHQKGIIHRDIKPTNILVAEYDQQPVPKVIDFGVAKATSQTLTEKTMFTGLGQIVGTLEYMSPEQAKVNQLDIDTRSDIYSLGVLLYELLTGSTPFDKQRLRSAAFDEMLRIIREEEPPKPSTRLSDSQDALPSISALRHTEPAKLTKLVRGELDWIVMKALEKDRNRRYETANGLAADLQRYLSDEPVQACPPSAAYRLSKFARRNKGGLAVAALVLFFLVLLGSSIGWAVRDRSAREAEIAQERANREADLTREREARRAKVAGQVESILEEVDRLQKEQKWPEALAAARRAEATVAGGEADAATGELVRQRLKDLEFIDRLEQIRMQRATWVEGKFDNAGANREYSRTFRDYGVDVDELAVEMSIDRLKARAELAIPLGAALDDWVFARRAVAEQDSAGWKRLVSVARGTDPEPLRDRLRATWGKPVREVQDNLRRLAESLDVRAQHPATLIILARTLKRTNHSASALRVLRDGHYVYPGDYWLNYDLGFALDDQKDFEGAIRFLTAAMSIRPHSAAAHNDLGVALSHLNRSDEAIAAFRKAIELDPRHAFAYCNLGNVLRVKGRLDEAIASYGKAIEIDPKFALAHLNLGLTLDGQNKLDEAIAAYRKVIEIDPKNAKAYNVLGITLRGHEKLNEAIDAFRMAVEIDPKHVDAYVGLGEALRFQGKLDEAIAASRKAIEIDPKDADAYGNLGNALFDQKKLDEAIAVYRTAIEIGSKQAELHYNLGLVLYHQRKMDEAIAAFKKAIEIDPTRANAHDALGLALSFQNKLDEAIAAFKKAIEIDPNHANAYSNLSIALRDQGKVNEAITACRKAVEIDPKFAGAHNNLGALLCDGLRDYVKAIECFRKAIELDPKQASAYVGLGNSLHFQGKLDEAITALRKAIELDPNNANAYHILGSALNGQKKWDEAIVAYKKALALDPQHANAHNGLAWLLATCPDVKFRDPGLAVALAKQAIKLHPNNWAYPNTLGAASYRAGDWKGAIAAMEKSMELRKGGDSNDWYFLAMAHWQLGEKDKAREWCDKAVQWMEANEKENEELIRFRAEAEELIKKE